MLPQHLKDMASNTAGTEDKSLMEALTSFTNLVFAGNTPTQIRPIFFRASLTALNKRGWHTANCCGMHLAASGTVTASMAVMEQMGNLLAPLQLGYGTPLGGEVAAHASRLYLHNLPSHHVLLKLDFKNAFNDIYQERQDVGSSDGPHTTNLPTRFLMLFLSFNPLSSQIYHPTS